VRRLTAALLILLVLSAAPVAAASAGTDPTPGDKASAKENVTSADATSRAFIGDADGNRISDDLDLILRAQPAELAGAEKTYPVVVLLTEAPSDSQLAVLKTGAGSFATKAIWTQAVNGFAADLTAGQIAFLAKSPSVQRIDNDRPVQAFMDTATQWAGVRQARTDFGVDGDRDGSATTYSKTDVVICVIDTGIDASHVDLDGGKVIGWKDFVNGLPNPYDDHGHGSHCAGIAAGSGDGNPAYRGVAPGAALVGVKVLDYEGSGYTSEVISGVNWMIANKATYGIRIGSMSLGSSGSSDGTDSLSVAVNNAVSNGIIMCVAAGNEGPDTYTVGSPAAASGAVTVGAAVDPGEHGWALAKFSSRGPTADGRTKPDICAPGYAITSVSANSGSLYRTLSGTSMATPFCAGVAALLLDANYALTDAGVKGILFAPANVKDFGPAGKDIDFGWGINLAHNAVRQAAGGSATWSDGLAVANNTGSLGGTGDIDYISLDVADASKPIGITFIISGWASWWPDFDIELFDPNGPPPVFGAYGVERQETILYQPSVSGRFTLRVFSWDGAGSYWVSTSYAQTFVPGLDIVETGGSTAVTEGGATDTYTVALRAQPLGPVTVTATANSQVTVNGLSSATLGFTPTDWSVPKTVTVRAVDDTLVEGPHYGKVTHTVSGGGYDSLAPVELTANVTDNDVLAVPRTLTASTTANGVHLGWLPPLGATVPTGYEVYIKTTSTGAATKVKEVTTWPGTTPNCEVTVGDCAAVGFTLTAGQTYYFHVKAYVDLVLGGRGVSLPSNTAFTVAGPIPPLPPRSLTGAATATGLKLGWLPALTGCAPQGYQVFIAPTSVGPFTLVKEVTSWTGTAPNCEVTQLDFADGGGGYTFTLTGGKRYAFQVRGYILPSVGGKPTSGPSNTATVTAGPLPPGAPTGLAARTTLLGVGLGWRPPLPTVTAPTPPAGYSVYIAVTSVGPWTFVKDVTTWTGDLPNTEVTGADLDGTGFTMTGGLRYSFRVFSFLNHPLTGQKVPSLMGATTMGVAGPLPPLAPTSLRGTTGADGFGLTWLAPLTGVTPQGYEVWLATTSMGPFSLVKDVTTWEGATPNVQVTSAEIAAGGLVYTPGARYSVKLYAYALHPVTLVKLVSARWAASTVTAGPLPPQAPTSLVGTTALPASGGGVNLTWKPPLTGAFPAGYAVHIAAVSTGPYTFVRNVTAWPGTFPSTQVTAGDCSAVGFTMTAGVRYYFRIYSFIYHPVTLAEIPSLRFGVTSAIAGALP